MNIKKIIQDWEKKNVLREGNKREREKKKKT